MRYLTSRKLLFYNVFISFVIIAGLLSIQNIDRVSEPKDVSVTDPVRIHACGPMDSNEDEQLTLIDFSNFARQYGDDCEVENPPDNLIYSCGYTDFNENGTVDLPDFANFAKKYNEDSCVISPGSTDGRTISLEDNGFIYEAVFNADDNEWDYTITGNLPSGCINANEKITIRESLSEQVDVVLELSVNENIIERCDINEAPIELTGSFSASIESNMTFEVNDLSAGDQHTLVRENNGVRMISTFDGSDTWNYTITGQVPNGCTTASVEVEINQSGGPSDSSGNESSATRTAVATVTLQENNDPNITCTQAFQDFELTGSYTSAGNTGLKLLVNNNGNVSEGREINQTSDGISVTSVYVGRGEWSYKITGQVPDGCTSAAEEIFVPQDGPGTVIIRVTLTTLNNPNISCTQAFNNFELVGTYNADEESELELRVERVTNTVEDPGNDGPQTTTLEDKGWTFQADYIGNNKWSYVINGAVSNGCIEAQAQITPGRGGAETIVNVRTNAVLTIGEVCSQAIKGINLTGEINGGENMGFIFSASSPSAGIGVVTS